MAKTKNEYPTVLMNPTGRVGGTNKPLQVRGAPTPYKGGLNTAACNVPTGKLKK